MTEYPTALLDTLTGDRLPAMAAGPWDTGERKALAYGLLGGPVVNIRVTGTRDGLPAQWTVKAVNGPAFCAGTLGLALVRGGFVPWPE